MMTACPVVIFLKIFCSPGIFHGISPCRPITRFLAIAAINEISINFTPSQHSKDECLSE
jgi:hypothetical protein